MQKNIKKKIGKKDNKKLLISLNIINLKTIELFKKKVSNYHYPYKNF